MNEHLDDPFLAKFIKKQFAKVINKSSNPRWNLFVQDGDLSGVTPPRSPDCNPVENLFHLVERKLQTDDLEQNIQHKPCPEFVRCINLQKVARK